MVGMLASFTIPMIKYLGKIRRGRKGFFQLAVPGYSFSGKGTQGARISQQRITSHPQSRADYRVSVHACCLCLFSPCPCSQSSAYELVNRGEETTHGRLISVDLSQKIKSFSVTPTGQPDLDSFSLIYSLPSDSTFCQTGH